MSGALSVMASEARPSSGADLRHPLDRRASLAMTEAAEPAVPLRVAILCHSINPRGGVVHGLELAEALTALGHEAVLHAPDVRGAGFFRATTCKTVGVPGRPVSGNLRALVETRVADYLAYFDNPSHRRFDVFHAQDSISGNALATLKERGLIPGFARTVHHLDDFADPDVAALQTRALISADKHFVVSQTWKRRLFEDYRIDTTDIGNGVDARRYTPQRDGGEDALRAGLGLRLIPLTQVTLDVVVLPSYAGVAVFGGCHVL
jgi:hypothetical protein